MSFPISMRMLIFALIYVCLSLLLIYLGWCMNTPSGTVKGKLEGDEGRMRQMMEWLRSTGSPKSKIEKAAFNEPKPIKEYSTRTFTIKR